MKYILILLIFSVNLVFGDSGGFSQENEIQSIKRSTMVNGKQTYPHGFHTNKRLQQQMDVGNSAKVDTLGADGVRYQIRNPFKSSKKSAKKRSGGFTFADMANRVNAEE